MQVDYDDFCRVTGCGSQSRSVLVMDSNPKRSKSDTVTYSDLLLLLHLLFQFLWELKEVFIGCEIKKPSFRDNGDRLREGEGGKTPPFGGPKSGVRSSCLSDSRTDVYDVYGDKIENNT